MEKKSIDLCALRGIDVAAALVSKLYNPLEVELYLGSTVLIISEVVHNIKDGHPVVSAQDNDGESITFQFLPDETPFRLSAIDADGQLICRSQVA
jgi:hypothetical protein